jgi:hypothetical protein
MKLLSRNREQGSVLVISLFTGLAIGIVLASFLALISSRYYLSVRSMGWNGAIPVLEAGIEEAMTHLHKDPKKPSTDGWTAALVGGVPVHTKTRKLPDGSYYTVWINNATSNIPVIYSSGFTPSPLKTNRYISRTVRVDTTNPPSMFVRAITTTQNIKLGGKVQVDSFDSDFGGYNLLTNRFANGSLATSSTIAGAVSVGGANVYGKVTTGPGGTVTVAGGAVGDVAWNTTQIGIQPGWTNNNFNAAFPTNGPPGGPYLTPTITSAGGSNVMYLATGTNKVASLSGSDPIIVTGDAALWVTGDISMTGGGSLFLIRPGASLTLYAGGSVKIGGSGVVNATGVASKFSLIGLPSCTSIDYSGTADFIGSVNAPQADLRMNGTPVMFGAAIVKSFDSVGVAMFHYDEALATGTGLVVTSWKEL